VELSIDKSVIAEFSESGYGAGGYGGSIARHFDPERPTLDCSNPSCSKGGFPVAQKVRELIQSGKSEIKAEISGSIMCSGFEGARRDSSGRKCTNVLTVRLKISFPNVVSASNEADGQ
jgi:hypothetical protein